MSQNSSALAKRLDAKVRDIPEFPKPGIVFKDITPMLQDAETLKLACGELAEPFRGQAIDLVVGIESRGFIFGPPVALALGVGFQIARKAGKLPWRTVAESYELEYGSEQIEMHQDAVLADQRVLLLDDVSATGGTAAATARLVQRMGGKIVGCSFLIELEFLGGRQQLGSMPVHSVLRY